ERFLVALARRRCEHPLRLTAIGAPELFEFGIETKLLAIVNEFFVVLLRTGDRRVESRGVADEAVDVGRSRGEQKGCFERAEIRGEVVDVAEIARALEPAFADRRGFAVEGVELQKTEEAEGEKDPEKHDEGRREAEADRVAPP